MKHLELLAKELQQHVQGHISTSKGDKHTYAFNFGRVIYKEPQIIVKSICEQDVVHTLRLSREAGVPVTIRGAGHSCYNHSLCDGGVVLVNLSEKAQFSMLDDNRVEVTTRTPWLLLEQSLNRYGQSTPVLPDYLNLSVGGTLSVGGYGRRSIVHGAQVDHIESLQLIKPNGEIVFCSPGKNEYLFRCSLTGLGQVGFVEKVTMRTIPYKKVTMQHIYKHKNIDALITSLEWIAEQSEEMPCQFNASYGVQENNSILGLEYETRNEALFTPLPTHFRQLQARKTGLVYDSAFVSHTYIQNILNGIPNHFNLWVDFFLDYAALSVFMQTINQCLQDDIFSQYVTRANILAIKNPQNRPHGIFRPISKSSTLFSVGLYPSIPPSDLDGLRRVQYLLRRALVKCLELGGFPYLYGWYDLDNEWKKSVYGDDYADLEQLVAKLDPNHLFNAGVFLEDKG